MLKKALIWQRHNTPTLEFFQIKEKADVYSASGTVVGQIQGENLSLNYEVTTDKNWQFLSVRLTQKTDQNLEKTTNIRRDVDGQWYVDDIARPDLKPCLEIDIAATPFTNTLPINRLRDALEDETELSMVYISVPGLAVEPVVQRYKALEDSADNRRYLYKGVFRGFEGVIDIDGDGLVLKYSNTFDRLSVSSQ
jgi:hypothetical protein